MSKGERIETSPYSGTRDFLGEELQIRQKVAGRVRDILELFGYEPLETPVFERLEILKASHDEGDGLLFEILKRGDESGGGTDLALRFDHTVPLARVRARYENKLPKVWKVYQLSPVWRAERPAKGRYREFHQADIDIVGAEVGLPDAEVILTIEQVLSGLGIDDIQIRLNSRAVLNSLGRSCDVSEEKLVEFIRIVDKADKMGIDRAIEEAVRLGASADILNFLLDKDSEGDYLNLRRELFMFDEGSEGVREVDELMSFLSGSLGARTDIRWDPLLARGLSYYTGPIFEFGVSDYRGSVAGGGRYDDLIGNYARGRVPACGGSLGLDRVYEILDMRGLSEMGTSQISTDVLFTVFDQETVVESFDQLAAVRRLGVRAGIDLQGGKLGRQLRRASQAGVKYVVIIGPDEIRERKATVRNMNDGEQISVSLESLTEHISGLVGEK